MAALLANAGCAPLLRRTERVDFPLAPWKLRTLQTAHHLHRYLHLPGPQAAQALVLLPGGVFDHRVWAGVCGLARNFEIFALDWPEQSPMFSGKMADWGRIASDFISHLDIDRFIVGGTSMGSYAAIDVALSPGFKSRVDGLVIASAVMLGRLEEEMAERERTSRRALAVRPNLLRYAIERTIVRGGTDEARDRILREKIFYLRSAGFHRQVFRGNSLAGGARQRLNEVNCPVLFVHGVEDELMPLWAAELSPDYFSSAPKKRFVAVPGAGHGLVFTHPQAVDNAVREMFVPGAT